MHQKELFLAHLPQTRRLLELPLASFLLQWSSKIMCRAMIDTGSQISLISEFAVQRMNLKRHKQTLTINGIGNVFKTYRSGSVSLRLKPSSGHSVITVNAYVLPSLTQYYLNANSASPNVSI